MRAGNLSGLPRREPRQADASDVAEDDSGLVRTVNTVVKQALDMGASDIHMEPDETGLCRVRLRVDGALRPLELQSDVRMRGVVRRLKIMAGLDVAEQRLPQDGVIQVRVDDVTYRLRVGTLPLARGGESVAIRVLSVDAFEKSLEVIFSAASLPAARELAARPAGIVIVSGAVGAGKTTTMYAMLAAQDAERRRVVAVESAPEARFTGVSQVQLAPHLGLTAPRALRAVMRHDPDVVMIGELSDPDTVQAAAHIASTGHLVLTQMHAPTPVGALMTLRELGLEPWLVNTTIAGIISQRLLRRLCPDCRRPGMPDASRVPPEALDALQAIDGAEPHVPVGCSACGGMGYRGRMAVHSVLRVSGALRLDAGADSDELHGAAKRAGMTNMFDDGLTAVAEGRTALEELCRVTWTDR
jgi:general secretion pathway protein E